MSKETTKVKSITIIGRRWRDRVNNNIYHTAQIMVNGVTVHKTMRHVEDLEYEHKDQYIETAAKWLEQNSYIPERCDHEPLWRFLKDDLKITFEHFAINVQRKKDI